MIPRMLPLVVYSFMRSSAAQTTSPTPSATPLEVTSAEPTPVDEQCTGCSLAPAITSTTIYNATATRQEWFLLFTAYNVAEQFLSDGICQLSLGSWIPVSPVYSVSQPATVNFTKFDLTANHLFSQYLGFSTCYSSGGEITPVVAAITTPTISSPSPLATVSSSSNKSSTQSVSTLSSGSHDNKVKIGNAVALPVAFLGLLSLGYVVYKHRKNQKTLTEEEATLQQQGSPHEDIQPYLEQKSELEAEEKRKHELEAGERRYEMGIEGERHELPVEEENLMIRTRQELRGEENSKELDVPH